MNFNFEINLNKSIVLSESYSCRETFLHFFTTKFPKRRDRVFKPNKEVKITIRIQSVAYNYYLQSPFVRQRNKSNLIDFIDSYKWDKQLDISVKYSSRSIIIVIEGSTDKLPNPYYFSGLIYYTFAILNYSGNKNLEIDGILSLADVENEWISNQLNVATMLFYKNIFLTEGRKYQLFNVGFRSNGPCTLIHGLLRRDRKGLRELYFKFLKTLNKRIIPKVAVISAVTGISPTTIARSLFD